MGGEDADVLSVGSGNSERASRYDAWFATPLGRAMDVAEARAVLGLADPQPGERALDVGCGNGIYTRRLAECGAAVTGLDADREMLAAARVKTPQATFVEGRVAGIPTRSESSQRMAGSLDLLARVPSSPPAGSCFFWISVMENDGRWLRFGRIGGPLRFSVRRTTEPDLGKGAEDRRSSEWRSGSVRGAQCASAALVLIGNDLAVSEALIEDLSGRSDWAATTHQHHQSDDQGSQERPAQQHHPDRW